MKGQSVFVRAQGAESPGMGELHEIDPLRSHIVFPQPDESSPFHPARTHRDPTLPESPPVSPDGSDTPSEEYRQEEFWTSLPGAPVSRRR